MGDMAPHQLNHISSRRDHSAAERLSETLSIRRQIVYVPVISSQETQSGTSGIRP